MDKLLTVEEITKMLGIKKSTLYSWVHAKSIPHIKIGRRCLRFRESDIKEWIASMEVRKPAIAECHKAGRKRSQSSRSNIDDIERLVNRAKREALK